MVKGHLAGCGVDSSPYLLDLKLQLVNISASRSGKLLLEVFIWGKAGKFDNDSTTIDCWSRLT